MPVVLPISLVGPTDINRLRRELNSLDDYFVQASTRSGGMAANQPPAITQQLGELAKTNKLNLLQKTDRDKLMKQLDELLTKAPKMRISFAVEPPPQVLATILTWLRQNLDPRILLSVGLQPNIGAGCVLRTPNREFDLSMRQHLIDSRPYLAQLIEDAAKRLAQVQPASQPLPAQPSTTQLPQQPGAPNG